MSPAHNNKIIATLYGKLSEIKVLKDRKLDDYTYYKKRFKEYIGSDLDLENPKTFNEKLMLNDLSEDTRIVRLYSIDGKLVDEINPAGQTSCQFNTQHLKPGIYILSVETSEGAYHVKVIKGN